MVRLRWQKPFSLKQCILGESRHLAPRLFCPDAAVADCPCGSSSSCDLSSDHQRVSSHLEDLQSPTPVVSV